MKILELSWEYPPNVVGGIGSHLAALAPTLSALEEEVTVVTPRMKGGDAFEQSGSLSVHRVEPPPWADNFPLDAQHTNERLDAHVERLMAAGSTFDIIHAHDWLVGQAAIALKQRHKLPLVATIHATERGRHRGYINGILSQKIVDQEWQLTYEAWRVIATSRFMASEINNYFHLPPTKIDVVPNGVDTQLFDALAHLDLSEFRLRYAAPDERLVFNVGRLTYEKGAHLLVEAVPHIVAALPNVRFVIAGRGTMTEALQARAVELGVADQILFAGFISEDERNRLYRVADCAVFPSLYEPFGIVALEAMAAHCPLVVASSGGLTEFVQHHKTGITVYPDSVESLVYGILHTLQHPDWAHARAERAYALVVERYNWRNIAERTMRVFQRVVEERKSVAW